jgi:hypothetical protein
MSRHAFLFSLFCVAIVALFATSAFTGYSPFANGGARPFHTGFYGPAHK